MTRNHLNHDIHFARFVHRLMLEAPSETPDGFGGTMTTWSLVSEVWGELRGLTGSEQIDGDRLSAKSTHLVIIRYRDGISPAMRFRFAGRSFAIRSIQDRDGRNRHLECRCEEVET
ncbi:MAG: phage head closure protein [Hyphomicrobiaceae bacterium]|nr:phage head closure protein [Hyphomicrobiaceae bacterium]